MYPFYAKDIMNTLLITVRPGMTANEVIDIFTANHISGAPVVDNDGLLVGVISVQDIIRNGGLNFFYGTNYFEESRIDRQLAKAGLHLDPATISEGYVSDYMTRNVYTALPDTPLQEIARIMYQNHIHRVIILKPGTEKPGGIVTTFDLLKVMAESDRLEAMPTEATTAL